MAVIPSTPNIRVTLFFKSISAVTPTGWTETHWCPNAVTSLQTGLTRAGDMAKKRAAMMGDNYMIQAIRVSKEGVFRDSRIDFTPYVGEGKNLGKIITSGGTDPGDFAYSCLLVRMESSELRRKSMYLSGIPDSLQLVDQQITDATWLKKYESWKTEMKDKWGFMGLDRGADNKAVNPKHKSFFSYDNIVYRRYTSHKRGRPFDLLRGRR